MKTLLFLLPLLLLPLAAPAQNLVNTNRSGLALAGYDAVAFHTEGRAVKGDPQFSTQHAGATYHFASASNLATFRQEPDRYLPAYGGYCAWAVSTKKDLAPVNIDTWQIIDGRLILNYNDGIKKRFNADPALHLRQADQNWPDLLARKGK